MRTDNPVPPGSSMDRLRSGWVRARRRLTERASRVWPPGEGRGWRALLPFGLAAVAGVGAVVVVVATGSPAATGGGGGAFVRSGASFSADDLKVVTRELELKKLAPRVDDRRRVAVAVDKVAEANEVLARLKVGPKSLSEIDHWAIEPPGLLDPEGSKEQRQSQARNESLAEMIRPLDGVADARVWVKRPKARLGQRTPAGASAFVYLQTVDDREVSHLTVQKIVAMISGFESDVKPDAVTVCDTKGRQYADARNPLVTVQTRDRAREEQLAQDIVRLIDWVRGVEVSVKLASAAPVAATVSPTNAPPAPPPIPPPAFGAGLPPLPPQAAEARPTVGVNQPLDLDTEPVAAGPASGPTEAKLPAQPAAPAPAEAVTKVDTPGRVRVWVKVPRSYYIKWHPQKGNREPSYEDLQPLVNRTVKQIEDVVRHVVPPEQMADVSVTTVPDEMPTQSPPPSADDARASPAWWVPAAASSAATALLMTLASRMLAARRPALRAARADRGRYKIDEPDADGPGPGPSERVRELIRLNPEAAASVLTRWTGQGGPLA